MKINLNDRLRIYIIFLFTVIYSIIVFTNHYNFRTYCFDYGVYNFAFYDYAHFRISECPLYFIEHMTFLQDHVSFLLMILAPFYWFFGWITGTYTLLLLQTAVILTGGWHVYALIKFKTNDTLLSALALLQYLVIYGRWTMFDADCNLAIFGSSLIPILLYYIEKKSTFLIYLLLVLLFITREDMPLWTFFIGLFYLVKKYKDREFRKTALIISGVSIFYFLIVFTFMVPMIENEYKQYSLFNYSALGKDPVSALLFVLKHPVSTLKLLFTNTTGNPFYNHVKFEFYYVYLLCGGFLLFYRPVYLLLFIPIVAKKMFNDEPLRWSTDTYYSVEFVSLLPVALFLILSEIKKKNVQIVLACLITLTTVTITVHKLNRHKRSSVYWMDDKHCFYKARFYKSSLNIRNINRQLEQIPPDAKVSATGTITSHIAFREKVYNFPKVLDAQYIVVFTDRDYYPLLSEKEFNKELEPYLNNKNWIVITDDSPFLILKKKE